jgi:hypothetical protein
MRIGSPLCALAPFVVDDFKALMLKTNPRSPQPGLRFALRKRNAPEKVVRSLMYAGIMPATIGVGTGDPDLNSYEFPSSVAGASVPCQEVVCAF